MATNGGEERYLRRNEPILTLGVTMFVAILAAGAGLVGVLLPRIDSAKAELSKEISGLRDDMREDVKGLGDKIEGVSKSVTEAKESIAKLSVSSASRPPDGPSFTFGSDWSNRFLEYFFRERPEAAAGASAPEAPNE